MTRPIRDVLGCSVVALHADDPKHGEGLVVSNPGLDPDEVDKYEAYYVRRNVWLQRAAPVVSTGTMFHGEELITRESLHRTEYYNDFAIPNELGRVLAVCLHHEPDLIAFFSMFKPPGRGHFTPRDLEVVRRLTPHLQRAAAASRTFQRLRVERALAEKALDALGRGAVVLDARGRVVFLNRRMREIAREGDGVFLSGDGLHFSDPSAQRRLETILGGSVIEEGGGAFRAPRPSLKANYEVVASPLPKVECPPTVLSPLEGRGGWLVLVTDPERAPERPRKVLERLYGLTEAEAEVADLLVGGLSLPEIGDRRGTTLNTAKSQARRVYDKIDVSSRAELVRRLGGLRSAGASPVR